MPEKLKESLRKKGWSEEDINKVTETLYSDEKQAKHVAYKSSMNKILYFMVLIVLVIGNFLVSIVLIPFLWVIKPIYLYVIVAMLGMVLGLLFNLLISDIEHLERKHHLFAAVFIPLIGLIDLFIIVSIANKVTEIIKITLPQNPWMVSVVYVVAFLLPYAVYSLIQVWKE